MHAMTAHLPAFARVLCAAMGSVGPIGIVLAGGGSAGGPPPIVSTTVQDFFQKGTQPLGAGTPGPFQPIISAGTCTSCHASYGPEDPFLMVEEHKTWAGSMMAQSARDPMFLAGLTIANQDAADAGLLCIRCHSPSAYLQGHAVPTDGSMFDEVDKQGVSCNFCHRLVDPLFVSGTSPSQDEQIINDLATAGFLTPEGSNSRYTVDPADSRRGPYDNVPLNIHPGRPQPEIIHSPFHRAAELCWTCHDVSNPLMSKQGDEYVFNAVNTPHPTGDQTEMMPLHRTYGEWKNSYYSSIGVQHYGRFGGNHATGIMKTCQDCHMPDTAGYGCNYEDVPPFFPRPDVPQHSFLGSNYWVLNAIRSAYPDSETFLSDETVSAAIDRNIDFLQKASDLELARIGPNIRARVINKTGHKLPTGFPDGRRIWINVVFLDCQQNIIQEIGAYDFDTATLNAAGTKVYEMHLGIQGAAYAQQIGLPEGNTYHFMLANNVTKDNRIPPAGFSNVLAALNQSTPVGATYVNGQSWDDTLFAIPNDTKQIVVSVNYQLTSREFIEFLRDTNLTDTRGQEAYNHWVNQGMSAPVTIDMAEFTIYRPEDVNRDGAVNVDDLLAIINAWGACRRPPAPCLSDVTHDGFVNVDDLLAIINAWGPC